MVDGTAHHQRQAGEARAAPADHDPDRRQFAVRIADRSGALATSGSSGPDGKAYCRVPVVRETLPNGRSYDTVELGRSQRGQFPAGHDSRRPCLPDGRQSRRFAPTAASPRVRRAASAARCRGRISAAAPSSSPSRSTARPSGGTRSAGSTALRGGRAGTSLQPNELNGRGRRPTEPHVERPGPAEFRDPAGPPRAAEGGGLVRHGAGHRRRRSSSPSRCC